jgi:hypothetical protein
LNPLNQLNSWIERRSAALRNIKDVYRLNGRRSVHKRRCSLAHASSPISLLNLFGAIPQAAAEDYYEASIKLFHDYDVRQLGGPTKLYHNEEDLSGNG